MTAFFIPSARTEDEAESVYARIRQFMISQANGPLDDRRIFKIQWRRENQDHIAQVGEVEDQEGQIVIAILKRKGYPLYYVCTPDRGGARGSPILVGANEVVADEDFDERSGPGV